MCPCNGPSSSIEISFIEESKFNFCLFGWSYSINSISFGFKELDCKLGVFYYSGGNRLTLDDLGDIIIPISILFMNI